METKVDLKNQISLWKIKLAFANLPLEKLSLSLEKSNFSTQTMWQNPDSVTQPSPPDLLTVLFKCFRKPLNIKL
eukprot:CAMPEP_0178890424 /NCGR_PEP_ID=MMETSP0747-20121128/18327_1 /TAXON_ID=913974 /ORGANISM="Nitzschia punctata, Strain CCMP561" /LENGTH=73 /DNA_ID=CAMNT_0020560059 /DNA_START=54 /DNA_END=271 /DNA_ORIENTATION=+